MSIPFLQSIFHGIVDNFSKYVKNVSDNENYIYIAKNLYIYKTVSADQNKCFYFVLLKAVDILDSFPYSSSETKAFFQGLERAIKAEENEVALGDMIVGLEFRDNIVFITTHERLGFSRFTSSRAEICDAIAKYKKLYGGLPR